jgi:hypothetical protein
LWQKVVQRKAQPSRLVENQSGLCDAMDEYADLGWAEPLKICISLRKVYVRQGDDVTCLDFAAFKGNPNAAGIQPNVTGPSTGAITGAFFNYKALPIAVQLRYERFRRALLQ